MGVTTTMLAGIAADLTARWLPTYEWEEARLQHRPPMASLYLERSIPAITDQGEMGPWALHEVVMRVHVSFKQREKGAQEQMRDLLDDLLDTLHADDTCDGAASCVAIADSGVQQLVSLEDSILIAELTLEIEPWPSL